MVTFFVISDENEKLKARCIDNDEMLNECPITWSSHLNPSVCTSTMMAEHQLLSAAMREVLPLHDIVQAVGEGL